MNIAVFTGSTYYFRPDSSLNHEVIDYYVPDGVEKLLFIPCIYGRICKAGKAVQEKFVGRYCSEYGFGCLIDDVTEGVPFGEAHSLDRTSALREHFLSADECRSRSFSFSAGEGRESVLETGEAIPEMVSSAIVTITRRSSFRRGDYVVVPLSDGFPLEVGDTIKMVSAPLEENGSETIVRSFSIL